MGTKKTILFDLFGTLCGATSPEHEAIKYFNCDSEKIHSEVQLAVCGTLFKDLNGGQDEYLAGFCKSLGIENNFGNRNTLLDIINKEVNKAINNIPFGRDEILETLQEKGYQLAIVSNSYPPTRAKIIEGTTLSKYFNDSNVFLSYEMGVTKQNPEIYSRTFRELNVSPENAIMIGDSLSSDIIQSKKATNEKKGGILIYTSPKILDIDKGPVLRTYGHDFYIVSDLREVPKIVDLYFNTN